MKRALASILFVFAVFTLPITAPASENRRKELSDVWLESKLVTTYTLNEHLNPLDLKVEVVDGTAFISGTVDSSAERDLAVEIARGVEGIEEVRHDIEVAPSDRQKEESRFFRDVADATLTAKVKSRLLWNRHTDGLDIDVDTRQGIVTLRGNVDSEVTRDLAVQLARNTRGVEKVEDRLKVSEQKAVPLIETTERAVNDSWITAKVKTMLLFSKEAEGADISVHTEDHVVTLGGTVRSPRQAERLRALVEDVVGVRDVRAEWRIERN